MSSRRPLEDHRETPLGACLPATAATPRLRPERLSLERRNWHQRASIGRPRRPVLLSIGADGGVAGGRNGGRREQGHGERGRRAATSTTAQCGLDTDRGGTASCAEIVDSAPRFGDELGRDSETNWAEIWRRTGPRFGDELRRVSEPGWTTVRV